VYGCLLLDACCRALSSVAGGTISISVPWATLRFGGAAVQANALLLTAQGLGSAAPSVSVSANLTLSLPRTGVTVGGGAFSLRN
jgi:hypothetical protein